jgi:Ca2+-binding RTX toxin-like protein
MRIKGTGKGETILGTAGSDLIDAGAGNDTIYSGSGVDTVTGGRGADTFVVGPDTQYNVITDFNAAEGDRIVLGASANKAAYTGVLWDGLSFETASGTCNVHCVDFNGDGIMDTQLSINGTNVFVLGCEPSLLHGADILG